jgi:hypothetical protein
MRKSWYHIKKYVNEKSGSNIKRGRKKVDQSSNSLEIQKMIEYQSWSNIKNRSNIKSWLNKIERNSKMRKSLIFTKNSIKKLNEYEKLLKTKWIISKIIENKKVNWRSKADHISKVDLSSKACENQRMNLISKAVGEKLI